jgi:hypothetical protein
MNRRAVIGLVGLLIVVVVLYFQRGHSSEAIRRQAYSDFAQSGTPEQVQEWVDKFHDDCFAEAYGYTKTGRRSIGAKFDSALYHSLMRQKISSEKALLANAARQADEDAAALASYHHEMRVDKIDVAASTPPGTVTFTMSVYDQKTDLTPDNKPTITFQLSCPGGGGMGGGMAPTVVMDPADWHFSKVSASLDLSTLKHPNPCTIEVSLGHKEGARAKKQTFTVTLP